jgi:hypothetical protein
MGFFIQHLHQQIEQLHAKQYSDRRSGQSFFVCRGQYVSLNDFQQMQQAECGLLSFNNFLSTSTDRHDH